jgi:hypothetical protein
MAELEGKGGLGIIAAQLFRTQKAAYYVAERIHTIPASKRSAYYGRVESQIAKLVQVMKTTPWAWGWGRGYGEPKRPHILFIETPEGPVLFRHRRRLSGPNYTLRPEGCEESTQGRVINFCEGVLSGKYGNHGPEQMRLKL